MPRESIGQRGCEQLSDVIELYRRDEMVEIRLREWQTALCIFQKEGWNPKRPIGFYAYPLRFVTRDEGRAMQRAGQSLFAKIDDEPAFSTAVPMDLGTLYRVTDFVGGGAFIVGAEGAFANAKANDFPKPA